MENSPSKLNEEIKRIKSLFTEERLYGNLVEQDEEYNKDMGSTNLGDGDGEKTKVTTTTTTDEPEDDFGKKRIKKEKVKKEKPSKDEKERKNFCKNGVSKYLKLYNKSSKEGSEGQDKVIANIKGDTKLLKNIVDCSKQFKNDNDFKKLTNIGDFLTKLGEGNIFPQTHNKESEGGGNQKKDIFNLKLNNKDVAKLKFLGSGEYEMKSLMGGNVLVNSNNKFHSWVKGLQGLPNNLKIDDIENKITDVSNNKKSIRFDIDK